MSAGSLLRRPAVFLALGLCAVAAVTTLLGHWSTGSQVEQKRTVLPDVTGAAAYPAFSADGNRLAYAQRGMAGGDVFHIVIRRLPTGAPQQLTEGAANDTSPAWSPDGSTVAFVRSAENKAQVVAMPAAGGQERVVAEFPTPRGTDQSLPGLAWASDGNSLAATIGGDDKHGPGIATIDAKSGAIKPLTSPAAQEGDWNPEFSPDARTILFTRTTPDNANLYTCERDGANLRQLTFENHAIRGANWMPNGRELIYSADRNRDFTLWRMAVSSGSPKATLLSPHAQFPAVSQAGNRIAFTESPTVSAIWRATLGPNDATPAADKAILRSQDGDTHAAYSPDGSKIAFLSETDGNLNIWVSDGEGANRVKVTDLKDNDPSRPEWSPDGKWLLYQLSTDQGWEIYKVAPTAGAKPSRVTIGGEGVAWARDGKSIYYQQRGVIYESKLEGGGDPKPMTADRRGRAAQPTPSVDGKYLYYRNGRAIWRAPIKGGDEELVFEPGSPFLLPHMEAGRAGIYFEEFDPGERAVMVSLYSFDTKRITHVLRLDIAGRGRNGNLGRSNDFSVSPDGKYILHPRVDQSQTNLVLVDNFR